MYSKDKSKKEGSIYMKQFNHKMKNYQKQEKKSSWLRKTLAGVIFAAACFIAAFVLVEFHDIYIAVIGAGLVLLAAAYFLLSELFKEKAAEWSALSDVNDDIIEKEEAEFRKKVEAQVESIDRSGKAMYVAMKKNSEQQEAQIHELEKKLNLILDEQTTTTKTIVKFNKENARQIAINERETMEHVMSELINEIKTNCDQITTRQDQMIVNSQNAIELKSMGEATISSHRIPDEIVEEAVPDINIPAPVVEEVEPDIIIPEPVVEEAVPDIKIPEPIVEEPAKSNTVETREEIGGIVNDVTSAKKNLDELVSELGDEPNATLSPEDIARLFAASGN